MNTVLPDINTYVTLLTGERVLVTGHYERFPWLFAFTYEGESFTGRVTDIA